MKRLIPLTILLSLTAHASDVAWEKCLSIVPDVTTFCIDVSTRDTWMWNEENKALCFESFEKGGMKNPDDICEGYIDFQDYIGMKVGATL